MEKSRDEMIRFVLDPDNRVVPDLRRKLPGRGVWITARRNFVQQAVDKRLFSRGFKKDVAVENELVQTIEDQLRASVTGLLSLARKANVLIVSRSKVEAQIRSGDVSLILQASNKDGDGKQKINRLAKQTVPPPDMYEIFTSEEMDVISGGVNTAHIALKNSGITEKINGAIRRSLIFTGSE